MKIPFMPLISGQRVSDTQTAESEKARQLYYFSWLWAMRTLALFILMIPLPIAWGRTLGPCIVALLMFIDCLDRQQKSRDKRGPIVDTTFPRHGITRLEWVLLLCVGVTLSLAALLSLAFDWHVWPASVWWGFDLRRGHATLTADLVLIRRLIEIHVANASVSGLVLWLRLFAIGALTVALWLPVVLLDWRFRAEMQGSNIASITYLPANPASAPPTPDGIVYYRPGDKQPLPPIPQRRRAPVMGGDGNNEGAIFEEEVL